MSGDDAFEQIIKDAENEEAATSRRKGKKLTISQLPESLQPVKWSKNRPRPVSVSLLFSNYLISLNIKIFFCIENSPYMG
jgi:hypothetical protein